jgi:hypothetical protein
MEESALIGEEKLVLSNDRCRWLAPVIPATRGRDRGAKFKASLGK